LTKKLVFVYNGSQRPRSEKINEKWSCWIRRKNCTIVGKLQLESLWYRVYWRAYWKNNNKRHERMFSLTTRYREWMNLEKTWKADGA